MSFYIRFHLILTDFIVGWALAQHLCNHNAQCWAKAQPTKIKQIVQADWSKLNGNSTCTSSSK